MVRLSLLILCFIDAWALWLAAASQHESGDTSPRSELAIARFVRPSGDEWVFESEIKIERNEDATIITSVTGREKSRLKIVALFDAKHRLLEAKVTTERGEEKQSGRVSVTGEKARVSRHDGQETELDCPPGVIVTSAPDWTDAFLMARRYDRTRGGKQEFAGLWIHPTQQPLRPTFTIAREGEDTVEYHGETVRLDRYAITLRGGSRYVGWSDAKGRLVKLAPESSPRGGIVLEGWEQATKSLIPPSK